MSFVKSLVESFGERAFEEMTFVEKVKIIDSYVGQSVVYGTYPNRPYQAADFFGVSHVVIDRMHQQEIAHQEDLEAFMTSTPN